jgi:LPS-assembly lipoprotein
MSLPKADRPTGSNGGSGGAVGVALRGKLGFAVFALLVAAPLLSACGDSGFRPLYGSSAVGGTAVNEKLAKVQVSTIPGRVGQRIRNELIFQSTGGAGKVEDAVYRLEVAIRESTTSTLIRVDGDAQSRVYNIEASFQLVRIADKAVLLKGNSHGQAAYERFTSIYSNVRAQKDAEDRAARTVGEELKSRLAAFLSSQA